VNVAGADTDVVRQIEKGSRRRDVLASALQLRGAAQQQLFALARRRRDECFPTRRVQVRSVIEICNICRQRCKYCNMGERMKRQRYLITLDKFLELVAFVYAKGRRHLLVQSGENGRQDYVDHVTRCVREVRSRHPDLYLILCLGNLKESQYRQIRKAGAESYILKFETSDPKLYHELKPRDTLARRLSCLRSVIRTGFAAGSGNMVGLPGQTVDTLVGDLLLLGKHDLAMQSSTVFIPGEDSKYCNKPIGDLGMTLNMLALMRILYPDRLIPSTSSLERAGEDGLYLGLMAGANTVTVHDGTPKHLKHLFPIYSTKRFTPQDHHVESAVRRAGLILGNGAGT
jgi:biotin synthase